MKNCYIYVTKSPLVKNLITFMLGAFTIWGGLPYGIQASHIHALIAWQTFIVISITILYLTWIVAVRVYRISQKQKQSIATIMSLIDLILKGTADSFNFLKEPNFSTKETSVQEIINRHKRIIQTEIDKELLLSSMKLSAKVTKEFLIGLKDDPNRQFKFNNACQKCINLKKIEECLRKELDGAQFAIQSLVTEKLFGAGKLERYAKYESIIQKEFVELDKDSNRLLNKISRSILFLFYPKLKEILTPEYYNNIIIKTYGVKNLADLINQQKNYYDNKIHFDFKVTGWDIFAVVNLLDIGGINEILTNSLADFLLNDLHINIGMEIAEWIGLGLLDITGVTLIYKGYRLLKTLLKMKTNGNIDIDKILSEVNYGFAVKINEFVTSECKEIETSSNSFVATMVNKVKILSENHNQIMLTYSEFISVSAYLKSNNEFDHKEFNYRFA